MTKRALVAIVDDEWAVRKSLLRLLRAAGIDAQPYASGQELLDACRLDCPDCVLIDLQMQGLTGIDVQERLACAGIRAPVVIITANDDPEARRKCIALGVDAYLLKPVDGEYLLKVIRSLLGRKEADVGRKRGQVPG